MNLPPLSPSQLTTLQQLRDELEDCNLVSLGCYSGLGRTTILRRLQPSVGGVLLSAADLLAEQHNQHPLSLEDGFHRLLQRNLNDSNWVLLDDLHLLTNVVNGCGSKYPRAEYLHLAVTALADAAAASGKKLIVATDSYPPDALYRRGEVVTLWQFTWADYGFLVAAFLKSHSGDDELLDQIDFEKVHRYAGHLDLYDLNSAAQWVRRRSEPPSTDEIIDWLRERNLVSNVNLAEVQRVRLQDLRGVDEVVEQLVKHIVIPLENDELASAIGLKPKRGVLLAGPPGTGKTTVGRALAHRLRGKFFKVDGTYVFGTEHFYSQLHHVFEQAKKNAPAVVFIDDADVMFENENDTGLYRYLLTLLDGLESESAGRVCVMLTAMDVRSLPPALIRSGRVELWLTMKLPDLAARKAILADLLAAFPSDFGDIDLERIAEATDGVTGADLKRLVEDGKALLAYDKVSGKPLTDASSYFLQAAAELRQVRKDCLEIDASAEQKGASKVAVTSKSLKRTASGVGRIVVGEFDGSPKPHDID